MIKKNIYRNKKTGQKVVTSEKLDKAHWEKVKEWRTGQIDNKKVKKK